jgi:flagellin-like protein
MSRPRAAQRYRRRFHRGVANIIAAVLMVAITLVVGIILWGFSLTTPPANPSITFLVRSGTSNPVWGDPSDCLPWFPAWMHYNSLSSTNPSNTTDDYIYHTATSTYSVNGNTLFGHWWNSGLANNSNWSTPGLTVYYNECSNLNPPGDFSVMNSSQFIVYSHSPSNILLSGVDLVFWCNGTVFVNGSLAAMTWFPGSTSQPAPNAPHLQKCGTYIPNGAFSTLYNRFGIFVPLMSGTTILNNGDTFIMYVHTSSPFDPDLTGYNRVPSTGHDCGPAPDCDDYHGAPPWCFTTPVTAKTGCVLDFYSTSQPATLLASFSLYGLIR